LPQRLREALIDGRYDPTAAHQLVWALAPHQEEMRARPAGREPRSLLLQIARELASLSEAPHVAGINRLVFAEALQAPDLARLFLDLHARAADDVRASL